MTKCCKCSGTCVGGGEGGCSSCWFLLLLPFAGRNSIYKPSFGNHEKKCETIMNDVFEHNAGALQLRHKSNNTRCETYIQIHRMVATMLYHSN